jgi:hypothetical protein
MMATMQDFGGLLFGMGGSGLEDYLSPQQTQGIQNQAMLQAAAALLSAGGPSARPTSLGQALGGALQAGQQGYSQAQQGAVQNLMVRQKLDEAKIENNLRNLMLRESGIMPTAGGATPTAAMPTGNMPMQGQPVAGGAPATQGASSGLFGALTPEQRRLMAFMKPSEAISTAFKAAGEKYSQLSPDELQTMGLQPNAVVFRGPTGKPEIISRPDFQYIETPAGGKQLIDMNNPLGTVAPRTAKAAVASGVVPAPSAAPTYAGGMAPAMKPEQINSAAQDWDKNFRAPVENILSSYNITKDLAMTGGAGISDYGVLIKALKALDPNSAVMQGEADSARQMQSMADRMQGLVERIGQGGVGADQARMDLVNLARSSASVAIDAYNRQAERKSQLLGQYMPQAAVKSIFQPYVKPSDLTSKAQMEKEIKAGTVAPAAGQKVWRYVNGNWVNE